MRISFSFSLFLRRFLFLFFAFSFFASMGVAEELVDPIDYLQSETDASSNDLVLDTQEGAVMELNPFWSSFLELESELAQWSADLFAIEILPLMDSIKPATPVLFSMEPVEKKVNDRVVFCFGKCKTIPSTVE